MMSVKARSGTKLRWGVVLGLSVVGVLFAAEKNTNLDDLLSRAKGAYSSGKQDEAIKLATQAIEAESTNARCYFVRARFYEEANQPVKAVADYDSVLKLEPGFADGWQHRGTEHFKMGQIKEAIADFDQFLALRPEQAPYHWQRGIAYYYAGQFEKGRKQFELHQTVNPNDVENAVWHFLCVARSDGVNKARTLLIPIKGDARVPMMEVHALFAGQAKPEDVLKAASGDNATTQQLLQLFYAHLYLALYYEAINDETKADEHIRKAAGPFWADNYMGRVARVHLQLKKTKIENKTQ